MNPAQAETIVAEFMRPLPPGELFGTLGRQVFASAGGTHRHRAGIFGQNPRERVLGAFDTHSARLECHSPAPNGPPPPLQTASDASSFHSLIRAYHQRGYTVRVPDVVPLSSPLQRLSRALECLLHQPVSAALFWSNAGARAQVHYDNRDNLVIQLEGRKRWFVSSEEPGLYNDWIQVGAAPPELREPQVIDLEPGDMIYVPRGTAHSVESTTESLHLAVLFNPVTVRDMLIAAIDHLSDSDRSLRETAVAAMGGGNLGSLPATLVTAAERLLDHCRSADFVEQAAQHRSARFIGDLPPLEGRGYRASVDADTLVRHSPLAIGNVRVVSKYLSFSQPGGHLAIHAGVEAEVRFIADTVQFRVGDIPGESGPEVRRALVERLINSGFLELVH